MPGARPHPQPCVQWKKARKQVTTGTPRSSGIPCTTVYRLIARSPRGAGLDSPRHLPITGKLDSSVGESGPHAFAVRFRAARLAAPKRPSHPKPNVRGDRASAPCGSGRGINGTESGFWKSEIFFEGGLDNGICGSQVICPSGKSRRERPKVICSPERAIGQVDTRNLASYEHQPVLTRSQGRSVSAHDTSVRESSLFRYIDRTHRGEVDIGCRSIHMKD